MSGVIRDKKIRCPKCGHEMNVRLHDTVGVEEVPELLDGSLFICECEECHEKTVLHYPVLFSDPDRHVMIHYIADSDFDGVIRDFKESSDLLSPDGGLSYRIVFSIDQLREKVLIAELGLDDRIIELIKIIYLERVFQAYPDIKIDNVFFLKDGDKYVLQYMGDKVISVSFDDQIYEAVKKEFPSLEDVYVCDYRWAVKTMNSGVRA